MGGRFSLVVRLGLDDDSPDPIQQKRRADQLPRDQRGARAEVDTRVAEAMMGLRCVPLFIHGRLSD